MCQIHPRLVRLLARIALMEDTRICHDQTPRIGRWRLGSAHVPDGDRQGARFLSVSRGSRLTGLEKCRCDVGSRRRMVSAISCPLGEPFRGPGLTTCVGLVGAAV